MTREKARNNKNHVKKSVKNQQRWRTGKTRNIYELEKDQETENPENGVNLGLD